MSKVFVKIIGVRGADSVTADQHIQLDLFDEDPTTNLYY